jgi:hypothetical protein
MRNQTDNQIANPDVQAGQLICSERHDQQQSKNPTTST